MSQRYHTHVSHSHISSGHTSSLEQHYNKSISSTPEVEVFFENHSLIRCNNNNPSGLFIPTLLLNNYVDTLNH